MLIVAKFRISTAATHFRYFYLFLTNAHKRIIYRAQSSNWTTLKYSKILQKHGI